MKCSINRRSSSKRKRCYANPTRSTTASKARACRSNPYVFVYSHLCSIRRTSDRTEKKTHHDLIPVPYRTAKAFEPAIYRNVAYDVYMNDHFKKYFDRNLNKQHQHIPFMTHNRLIERFGRTSSERDRSFSIESFLGVKMHLPVSYLNPPDCRRVIVCVLLFESLSFHFYRHSFRSLCPTPKNYSPITSVKTPTPTCTMSIWSSLARCKKKSGSSGTDSRLCRCVQDENHRREDVRFSRVTRSSSSDIRSAQTTYQSLPEAQAVL